MPNNLTFSTTFTHGQPKTLRWSFHLKRKSIWSISWQNLSSCPIYVELKSQKKVAFSFLIQCVIKRSIFQSFLFRVKLGLAYVQLFWPVLRRAWHSANIRFVATLSDSVTLLIFSKSICEGRVAWTSLTRYLSTFGLFLSLIVTYLTNRLLFRWSQKASGVTIQSNLMHIHSPPTSSSTVHLVWFWLSLFFSFSPLNEFSATIKLWPEELK